MTASPARRAPQARHAARAVLLAAALILGLSACDQKPPASPSKPAAKAASVKPRRCPDPDNRNGNDPCSVSYLHRPPPRFTDRDTLP